MTGLYFSGTGNTRHCVEQFVRSFDPDSVVTAIKPSGLDLDWLLGGEDTIVFGSPVYFSNTPKMVRDFILNNATIFRGKRVFIIATIGLFSGDGAGCAARIFRRCGAKIVGGLHLVMPDCIADVRLLKKSPEDNRMLIRLADKKIDAAVEQFKVGKPTREGLNIFYHIAGLLGQRLWFYRKTLSYKNKPDIDHAKCTVCGLCVKNCPTNNLEKRNGVGIVHGSMCTMCYRCVNGCPTKAMTILGKKVHAQWMLKE